jgi:hypothetical protein
MDLWGDPSRFVEGGGVIDDPLRSLLGRDSLDTPSSGTPYVLNDLYDPFVTEEMLQQILQHQDQPQLPAIIDELFNSGAMQEILGHTSPPPSVRSVIGELGTGIETLRLSPEIGRYSPYDTEVRHGDTIVNISVEGGTQGDTYVKVAPTNTPALPTPGTKTDGSGVPRAHWSLNNACTAPCSANIPESLADEYGVPAGRSFDLKTESLNYTSFVSPAPSGADTSSSAVRSQFSNLSSDVSVAATNFSFAGVGYTVVMAGSPPGDPIPNLLGNATNVPKAEGQFKWQQDWWRTKQPAAYVDRQPMPASALHHELPEATVQLARKSRGRN